MVRHSDHTPVRTLVRTKFFRQNLQPRNLLYGLSLIFWTKTELLGCLTCLRGPRHGDFQDAEIVLLRRIYFDFLRHAVACLAHRYWQEQDFAALHHAIYLSDEAMVVAKGTSRVIAGSKPALRMLQSWNGNGALSHKLPKGKIILPEAMQVWSGPLRAGEFVFASTLEGPTYPLASAAPTNTHELCLAPPLVPDKVSPSRILG